MADSIICLKCGKQNEAENQVCEHCGASLPNNKDYTLLSTMGVQLRTQIQEILAEEQDTKALKPNQIALQVVEYGTTLKLTYKKPILLGRGEKVRSPNSHFVDLTNYNAYGLGLSRDHAEIRYENDAYYLIDLGSSNGTSLNQEAVAANAHNKLKNGDQIILARMGLIFYSGQEQTPG